MHWAFAACQYANSTVVPTEEPAAKPTQTPQTSLAPPFSVTPKMTVTVKPTEEEILAATASPQATIEQEILVGERVEFAGTDGLILVGTLYTPGDSPSPWPGMMLLHMMWGARKSWEDFAIQLADAG